MISLAQDRLYFREWGKARRALRKFGLPPAECDARRHEIHVEKLGADKSHTDFTNHQLDLVLAGFRAISEPANLIAQLEALDGAKKRLRYGIEQLSRSMGKGRSYIDGIVKTMNAEGKLGTSHFEDLDETGLEKVMVALRKSESRAAAHPF